MPKAAIEMCPIQPIIFEMIVLLGEREGNQAFKCYYHRVCIQLHSNNTHFHNSLFEQMWTCLQITAKWRYHWADFNIAHHERLSFPMMGYSEGQKCIDTRFVIHFAE